VTTIKPELLLLLLFELFDEIWLHDFEFVSKPGEIPDVVCLVAHELRSGRTLRLWRDQLDKLGKHPPYRTDRRVLFISFVANAECSCHLSRGWPLPVNVLDLSPAFRKITNGRQTPEGKGLIGALRYFHLDAIGSKQKDAMHKRIMQGWPFTPEEEKQILDYCESDIDALRRLLPAILADPEFDLKVALYHGEFAAVSAQMEHWGVPIDMDVFPLLADKEIWRGVRDAMVPAIDAQYGVYVRDATGDWSFSMKLFMAYLEREGITGWPLLESGKLNLRRKTFEDMSKGWPQLEDLRQLRHARDKMRKVKLAVGRDGRNRSVLWPFKAKTSRTQPKASEWIFSPAVWLRSLIKPGPGMAVAYIDYSSMEFLIAASKSDRHCDPTNTMLDMYNSGDPYRAFAVRVGAIPDDITTAMLKKPEEHVTHNLTLAQLEHYGTIRDRYKTMLLAVQYGMQTETLAGRLGVSTFEAHEMLGQHRELFAQYWQWSEDWVQHALQTGVMWTAMGWSCRTGITEFNERSIRNWPIQAAGADILRIACILAVRHGIKLLAPVHDAVLIEAPIDRIEADVALMQEIMRRASRIVLNVDASGTHELRTDYTIVRYPDRYSDKRGGAIWKRVLQLIAEQQSQVTARRA
jgi:DNA polymerase-1